MTEVEKLALRVQLGFGQEIIDAFRKELEAKPKEWLVEQLVESVLDNRISNALRRRDRARRKAEILRARLERLAEIKLDEEKLRALVDRYREYSRESLIADGFMQSVAPEKGLALIKTEFRSDKGDELLNEAKDVFYGLLFGDESLGVTLQRTEQELLTLTMPRFKLEALDFMKAMTEMTVVGSWVDPDGVSNDQEADNVQITVEYGEVASELVGDGICATLSVINNLEINEQILYARMINVEQTTLIE